MKFYLSMAAMILVALVAVGLFDAAQVKSDELLNGDYRRAVSLAPSMTETVIALEQGFRLVGITSHCPKESLPQTRIVGSFAEPNFEAIMALNPDLVLAVPHIMANSTLKRLRKQNIQVYSKQPDSIEDIKSVVMDIAQAFKVRDKGEVLVNKITLSMDGARNEVVKGELNLRGSTALIAIAHMPFVVAGKNTFPSQIIETLGLVNMVQSSSQAWPVWPLEKLLAEPPKYLILANGQELAAYQNLFSSLGLKVTSSGFRLIVPSRRIFASPSPMIIKDTEYLLHLLRSGV